MCVRKTRIEWINRLKLECFGRPDPFFTTWTIEPERYDGKEDTIRRQMQLFWKKLRKQGIDIRYFSVIERGSKNGRLHAHSVLWSRHLSAQGGTSAYLTLKQTWGLGIIDMQNLRSAKGLSYVTKYILKDLDDGKRNYTWSSRPMLGDSGRSHWINQCNHYHEQMPFDNDNLPPNRIVFPIAGRLEECWIPKTYWMDYSKSIGIKFELPPITAKEGFDILGVDYESKVYQQVVGTKYRKAKAIQCA